MNRVFLNASRANGSFTPRIFSSSRQSLIASRIATNGLANRTFSTNQSNVPLAQPGKENSEVQQILPAPLSPAFHHTTALAGSLIGFGALAVCFPSSLLISLPTLIAPLAASTALVYGAPAAPFSQPKNVIGGQTLSALTGIVVHGIPLEVFLNPSATYVAASALSVSLSIFVMLRTGTMHPPAAGTALLAGSLGGPAVFDAGLGFALWSAGLPATILVAAGYLWNRAVARYLSSKSSTGWPVYPAGGKWW